MDNDQAKFILRSFRPDGADVDDSEFAEALTLALTDRELSAWLADERAFDSQFANALAAVELPENLRHDILGCLAGQRGDFPQADDALDAALIGAFASICPPQGLRQQILMAMARSNSITVMPRKKMWRRLALPVAAAAGVMLALTLTRNTSSKPTASLNQRVPVDLVQASFIRAYQSPLFSLDHTREEHAVLIDHLKSRKLPCPGCLPPGLQGVKSIGCRELTIESKRGSVVCFDEPENGVVHLVIFHRDDVDGELPAREHPTFAQEGHWATARWEDESHVFILIGTSDVHRLASLF